ncbi:hypothetical protein [Mycolicibacterium sp. GF69]|uniref:hypothetical protein n=1 Tax=Mycolicibacterium sp. GF69 TaxID=2267251 RepID=UPI001403588B|nr:hypothetical protein [Mycolicibacterium sp. GF69]
MGFQYSPGAHATGTVATAPRHTFATGSHHWPFGQLTGCAEADAAIMKEKAATGAAATETTTERRTILFMG